MKKTGFLLLLLTSCAPDDPEPAAPTTTEEGTPPMIRRERPPVELLTFTVPEAWVKEEPDNFMRKAQYRLPDKEKKAADAVLALFRFRISSPVDENFKRWSGQMGGAEPRRESIEGKCKVELGDFEGNYSGDSGGEPIENARMLGAILETTDGEQWFFKLVGPAETVDDWRKEFKGVLREAFK